MIMKKNDLVEKMKRELTNYKNDKEQCERKIFYISKCRVENRIGKIVGCFSVPFVISIFTVARVPALYDSISTFQTALMTGFGSTVWRLSQLYF